MNEAIIELSEGESVVVGYGSLLSIESVSKTLKRDYRGPFITCHVEGWRRSWDVAMPNQAFYYQEEGKRVYPKQILYLNVRPAPGVFMNCVGFAVNSDELTAMHHREWIYDPLVVTGALRGLRIVGGEALMYVARKEHLLRDVRSPHEGAVRASYLGILQQALQKVTPLFRSEYKRTTDPVPAPLVIDDTLDPDRPTPWAKAGYDYHPQP